MTTTDILLIILTIVMVVLILLLVIKTVVEKRQRKKTKKTSSLPLSLNGVSDTIVIPPKPNDDTDVVEKLEAKAKEEQITEEQKEIITLMTSNREHGQYKNALERTIREVRAGKNTKSDPRDERGD